jgi:hypothetical protein
MAQLIEKSADSLGLDRVISNQESEVLGGICTLCGLHGSPPSLSPGSPSYP